MCCPSCGTESNAIQAEVAQVTDEAAQVLPIRQAKPAEDPDDGHDTQGDEALHHDGEHVLAAHQAAVEERQAGRHDEDKRCADQHKRSCSRIDIFHKSFSF